MCRLFGFRSVINSQVHTSLLSAENALAAQSNRHPDGWGVGYYAAGAPHIVKSTASAVTDKIFKKVSGVVSSQTVIAHIRKSTQGENNILNTHPFQFGKWVFAHNGNVRDFSEVRDKIAHKIPGELRKFILGKTDSEIIFYFLLGQIQTKYSLSDGDIPIPELSKIIKDSINQLIEICGPFAPLDDSGDHETYFTFLLTNGETMVAHHGGKNLHYSTYKSLCPDRDVCDSFAPECEEPTKSGMVNHLIFSSEPLSGENIWIPMKPGQIIGVDKQMRLSVDQ